MAEKIFLIGDDGTLRPMTGRPYETELHLQDLLVNYRDLLPGEQIDEISPRRWLLVNKEMPVADSEDGADRWSVDHLFLDQDGVPTLVETKRSSDTRLRREVIGQMLEYAANAVIYWPIEKLRADFQATCEARHDVPDDILKAFLTATADYDGKPLDVNAYWDRVETNLAAERIRLILVADEVPPETRRIIEFLNGQMKTAEILAVEIRQFVSDNGKTKALVPRVLGNARKRSQVREPKPPSKKWDKAMVLSEIEKNAGPAARAVAEELMKWAQPPRFHAYFSGGWQWGSCNIDVGSGDDAVYLFRITSNGSLDYAIGSLSKYAEAFTTVPARDELLRRVNERPGTEFPRKEKQTDPGRPLPHLADPAAMAKFKQVMEWIFDRLGMCR